MSILTGVLAKPAVMALTAAKPTIVAATSGKVIIMAFAWGKFFAAVGIICSAIAQLIRL